MFIKGNKKSGIRLLTPARIIILGFLLLILAGTLFLSFGFVTNSGKSIGFLDAFFTSTSSVCVTGMLIYDVAATFNIGGQVIILLLIQCGGLGIMTIATLIFAAMRKRLTLKDRMVLQSALNENAPDISRLLRNIFLLTIIIELAGALLLLPFFIIQFGGIGVFKAVFTSVSAFCNAGIDIFGTADAQFSSMTGFYSSVPVLLTTSFLVILGGLGFAVIIDVLRFRKNRRLTFHSKIVLSTTGILILSGFVLFMLTELSQAIQNDIPFGQQLLNAWFNSVAPRSSGYYTTPTANLSPAGRFLSLILMLIGASPASTGGGIKTSTFTLIVFMVICGLKNRGEVIIAKRTIKKETTLRAVSIVLLYLGFLFLITLIMLITESGSAVAENGMFSFENILYEVLGAGSTSGMSLGITPYLSVGGKLLIILTMFFGRIGPLTVGLLFLTRPSEHETITYPETDIMIG